MDKRIKEYENAASMYASGLSIQAIAVFYGITRQAMHAWLVRRNVKMRDNKRFMEENHFHRGGSRSDPKCHDIVEQALKIGAIERKSHCEECGDTSTFKNGRSGIEAHHDDYNNPLDVRWLCQKCHHEWHKKNKAVPRIEVA